MVDERTLEWYNNIGFVIKSNSLSYTRYKIISPKGGAMSLADTKHSYEFVLVISVKVGEKIEELVNKFKNLIESNAEISNISRWGKKKFTYPIKKELEGEYVLFEFSSNAEFPEELDRVSKIDDGVLRSMIVRKDA